VRSKPIWIKSVICGLIYIAFSLLIIFVVYTMDFFEGSLVLGALCGIAIAFITSCDSMKRTVIARIMGILSALISQEIISLLGIPSRLILYVLRNDEWIKETGRLTVNEVIGYNFGRMFFWFALAISFAVFVIGIFVYNIIKNRTKGENANESE